MVVVVVVDVVMVMVAVAVVEMVVVVVVTVAFCSSLSSDGVSDTASDSSSTFESRSRLKQQPSQGIRQHSSTCQGGGLRARLFSSEGGTFLIQTRLFSSLSRAMRTSGSTSSLSFTSLRTCARDGRRWASNHKARRGCSVARGRGPRLCEPRGNHANPGESCGGGRAPARRAAQSGTWRCSRPCAPARGASPRPSPATVTMHRAAMRHGAWFGSGDGPSCSCHRESLAARP